MRIFGLIFACFALIFIGVGVYMAWNQKHKLTTYLPVKAVILDKGIDWHTHSESDSTYSPWVKFHYEVNDRTYEYRGSPLPVGVSSGHGWASGIIGRFNIEDTVDAYYNPDDPSEAFLLREAQFFPYVFVLFPMLFVGVGLGLFIGAGKSSRKPVHTLRTAEGWYRLLPRASISTKRNGALLIAVLWWAVGAGVAGHFASVAGKFDAMSKIALSIHAVLGLIPTWVFIRYLRVGRRFGEAMVLVDNPEPARGDVLAVYVEQPVLEAVKLRKVRIGVICDITTKTHRGSKTTISTSTCYRDEEDVSERQDIRGGDAIRFDRTIHIPKDRQPTQKSSYPKYT